MEHTRPDLTTLFSLFPSFKFEDVAALTLVPGPAVPPPYHDLLVHEHHMTVTVEEHHKNLVYTETLERHITDEAYARMILLRLEGSDRPVQFGIMRVYYRYLSEEVRQRINAGRTPLGRILIEHNVLRRIEPTAFVKVAPGPLLMRWFAIAQPKTTYGRLAFIHCNEQPAVELLEIVAPE